MIFSTKISQRSAHVTQLILSHLFSSVQFDTLLNQGAQMFIYLFNNWSKTEQYNQ